MLKIDNLPEPVQVAKGWGSVSVTTAFPEDITREKLPMNLGDNEIALLMAIKVWIGVGSAPTSPKFDMYFGLTRKGDGDIKKVNSAYHHPYDWCRDDDVVYWDAAQFGPHTYTMGGTDVDENLRNIGFNQDFHFPYPIPVIRPPQFWICGQAASGPQTHYWGYSLYYLKGKVSEKMMRGFMVQDR